MICLQSLRAVAAVVGESQTSKFYRGDIQLDKGAKVDKYRVDKNVELYKQYMTYFINYPDKFIDLITPVDSKVRLKFFQKMFLRVCLRYGRVLTIAPRAAGKSFICILALYLICIFRPKVHVFICSPGKTQSVKIATAKIKQLIDMFPLLKNELFTDQYANDYVKLTFRNGSIFDVITPLNSSRGQRANVGILDEFRFLLDYYSTFSILLLRKKKNSELL